MNPLFPQLPEDLTTLSDEELAQALSAHLSAVQRIKLNDSEFIGERTADQVVEELKAGVEQIKALRAETKERAEAAETYEKTVAELASEAGAEEEEAEELAAEDSEDLAAEEEDATTEEATPATTSGSNSSVTFTVANLGESSAEVTLNPPAPELQADAKPRMRRVIPAASAERTPSKDTEELVVRASHGIEGVPPGKILDRRSLAEAMIAANRGTTVLQPGIKQEVVVASVDYTHQFGEERTLDMDPAANGEKFRAQLKIPGNALQAFIAAGSFCAPYTPFYDSVVYATAARPVRDGLPSYRPMRGGITYPPALSLADARDAITVWDAETDAEPGTQTKACLVIDCPEFLSAEIYAVAACVQHQNFSAMTWPERIAELDELVSAAHAETGEVLLLDALKDGSTQVTDAGVYGAVSSLISAILQAAAGIRNRERMTRDRPMRVLLPMWVSDLLVMDTVNSQFDRFGRTQAGVTTLLQQYGVNVSWYMDGETGGGQTFPSQAAAALEGFPTAVKWFMWPEGTWIVLDRGRLDLGIVRDSLLNATNTFQTFYETFEGIAKIGPTSLEVTSTICASGATGSVATDQNTYTCS